MVLGVSFFNVEVKGIIFVAESSQSIFRFFILFFFLDQDQESAILDFVILDLGMDKIC